jgi:peptidoglycan/LPS O-acetylase OafA/YrhL
VAFILCYRTFSGVSIPFSRALYHLGTRSYGIYLIHYLLMTLVAKVIYRFVPWLLGQQLLYQPILLVVGFGGVLLLMATVSRSPMRRYYRFLFG